MSEDIRISVRVGELSCYETGIFYLAIKKSKHGFCASRASFGYRHFTNVKRFEKPHFRGFLDSENLLI